MLSKIIGSPTALTTSGQNSNHFVHFSSTNNDTATLQPVIENLLTRQKSIFECRGRIGHKANACIICGPKLIPPSIIINVNQLNYLNGNELTEQPREWNSQYPEAHFKYRKSPPKTSPVVSAIIERLNHRAIDNGGVKVHNSEFPVELKSEPVTDTGTTPNKSIDDD